MSEIDRIPQPARAAFLYLLENIERLDYARIVPADSSVMIRQRWGVPEQIVFTMKCDD